MTVFFYQGTRFKQNNLLRSYFLEGGGGKSQVRQAAPPLLCPAPPLATFYFFCKIDNNRRYATVRFH